MSTDVHTLEAEFEPSKPSSESIAEPKRTITITVLYFAAASTATGLVSESIELPLPLPSSFTFHSTSVKIDTEDDPPGAKGFPLGALASFLSHRHPNMNLEKILLTSRWSVDAEMVDDPEDVFLKGGEEVAVICPVSGG